MDNFVARLVRRARRRLKLRVARIARAVWRESIWHPDAIPSKEGELAAELKRYVLPTLDVFIIIMGVAAVHSGMPSFNILYDHHVSRLAAIMLLTAGPVALVGVGFPRLWLAEALGKIVIVGVLGGYAAALWVLYFIGEGQRAFVAAALTALCILPTWNLIRLGRERRRRKLTTALVAILEADRRSA